MLHRCCPYGACGIGGRRFYTDVTPTGFKILGHRFSTQMLPLRGLRDWGTTVLHRCHPYRVQDIGTPIFYTDVAPTGLAGLGDDGSTQSPLRGSRYWDADFLHRCRPYGARGIGEQRFYTDVTLTGFKILGHRFSTQMSPLRGCCDFTGFKRLGTPIFYTDVAPMGLSGLEANGSI